MNVTASRTSGTVYTNSTGKPIEVAITGAACTKTIRVGGIVIATYSVGTAFPFDYSFVVPNAATYSATISACGANFTSWAELR